MKIRLLILLIFLCNSGYSQPNPLQPDPSKLIQSPNAASLGVYGKIDVSSFTGLANISIPVFSLREGDIDVNCQLQYFSGGVKPEQHPGWVGQNWSLDVGGQVTRKVNVVPDEILIPGLTDEHLASYYDHHDYLDVNNNWHANQYMETTTDDQNFNNVKYLCKLEPDEYMFSLPNGISGSFFLDHAGVWRVKSKTSTSLKVNVEMNPTPFVLTNVHNTAKSLTIKRLVYKITITDPAGYKYTFGNTPASIEFGRGPGEGFPGYNQNVIASTWNLTKIESPTGYTVTFEYVRKENQYHINTVYPTTINGYTNVPGGGSTIINASSGTTISGQIVTPSFLSKITGSAFNVLFEISPTTELKYPFVEKDYGFTDFKYDDLDVLSAGHNNPAWYIESLVKYYKLDRIKVTDINNVSNTVHLFAYSADPTKRLTLNSLSQSKNIVFTDDPPEKAYQFTYDNTVNLPGYNSLKVDKWGYYNNKIFPQSGSPSQGLGALEMDQQYAKAGILTRIKYPTGGYTDFTYEPNSYSAIIQKTNNSIVLLNQSGIGGGLRIKQITNFDNLGNQSWKKYWYTPAANPTASSGVLAGLSRIAVTEQVGSNPVFGSFNYFTYTDKRALNYTNGKEVTYSEVKEELQDGSYTISKFSNSDDINYRDKVPFNTHSFVDHIYRGYKDRYTSSWTDPYMTHISMDLERGNLLWQEIRNSTGVLVKKTENTYNSNPARFDQFVRSVHLYRYVVNFQSYLNGFARETYLQALKTYTYVPYLEKQTEYNYAPNGQDYLKTETDFTYDPQNYQLIKKTVKASNNDVLESVYKYPTDFSATSPYNDMVTRNIIAPVIEKTDNRIIQNVSKEMSRMKTNYSYSGSNILPLTFQKSVGGNAPETESTYNLYDSKGNILQVTGKDGIVTSYIWGYNSQYIVAKVVNKTYTDVINLSGVNQTILNNPATTDADMRTELDTLRHLSNCYATTYTYKLLTGITSETDPNGRTTYYEYDWLNRLALIRDKDNNIIKKICYNYYNQVEDCTTPCPPNPQPNWQNTTTALRCQQGSCGNTGYQEQEQRDINTCSPTYNSTRWVVAGYNPAACPPACVNLTSTNIPSNTGYTASYYNLSTGITYNFSVSTAAGLQPLGTLPAGNYDLTISRTTGMPTNAEFKSGCNKFVITGTSASYYNIPVSVNGCNSILINTIFN